MLRLLAFLALAGPAFAGDGLGILHTFSGNGRDKINALTTDREGNIYLAGETTSTDFPLKDAAQPRHAGGVYVVSRDGGKTWSQLGPFHSQAGGHAPSASPHDGRFLLASAISRMARSEDGGATWSMLGPESGFPASGGVQGPQWDPTRPGVVYATSGPRLLRSTDFGTSWVTLAGCPGNEAACNVYTSYFQLDPQRSGRILHYFGGDAGYFVSSDSGASWEKLQASSPYRYLAMSTIQPDVWMAASAFEEVFLTRDAGKTWEKLPYESGCGYLRGFISRKDIPGGWLVRTECEVQSTDDNGATWRKLNLPAIPHQGAIAAFAADPFEPRRFIVSAGNIVAEPSSLFVTEDGGLTWTSGDPPRLLNGIAFDAARPGIVYGSALVTRDGFITKLDPEGRVLFSTYLGGASDDGATAISVAPDGAVFVAGFTRSLDFPAVAARHNGSAPVSSFVARLDHAGRLERSILLGEATISGVAQAPGGELLVAGFSTARAVTDAPYTMPPLASPSAVAWDFLLRLDARGLDILHGRLLGRSRASVLPIRSVAADSEGNAYLTGSFEYPGFPGQSIPEGLPDQANLLKLSRTGELVAARWLPNDPGGIVIDDQDFVFVAGTASVLNPVYAGRINTDCPHYSGWRGRYIDRHYWMTDISVMKFAASLDQPAAEWLFGGACREELSYLALDGNGDLLLAGQGYSDPLPAPGPVLGTPPAPGEKKPFYARLSTAQGEWTEASYLMTAYAAGIAGLPDGIALFAANNTEDVWSYISQPPWTWLLRLAPPASPLSIERVVNAFAPSASPGPVSPGEIVRIEIAGFDPENEVNLWIAPAAPLPLELDGVEVHWDGIAAPIMAVGRGFVVSIVPSAMWGRSLATVRVRTGGGEQASAFVEVVPVRPALYPDIRNEDGTLNSPENPAPSGSRVTLFFTGLGPILSELPDGAIVEEDGKRIPAHITLRTNDGTLQFVVEQVEPLVGFVKGLWAGHAVIEFPPGDYLIQLLQGAPLPLSVGPAR